MNLGETQEALVHFQRDVELSPQAAKSHFLLGQARFQMKQYREAKQSYLRATEIWPEFWNAYYSLARVSAKLGEKEEAKKYQAKFKELKALELDDLIDRSTSFDDLVAVRKGVAKTLNSAARVHRSHDDSPRAVALWQRAVALDSQDVVSRQALATLFQTTDRLSEALRLHRELTILQPDNPTHFLDMGVVGVRLKQLDQAKTAFAQAIELAPDKADGYGMLASVYLMRNEQLPEAKRLATKAVSLEPSARNYFLYSQSLDKTGDRPGAVAAAKRAVELDPTNAKYRRVYSYLVTHN